MTAPDCDRRQASGYADGDDSDVRCSMRRVDEIHVPQTAFARDARQSRAREFEPEVRRPSFARDGHRLASVAQNRAWRAKLSRIHATA